jgi:hypothetical protein
LIKREPPRLRRFPATMMAYEESTVQLVSCASAAACLNLVNNRIRVDNLLFNEKR